MTDSLTVLRAKRLTLPTISYGYSIFNGEEEFDFKKVFKEADQQKYHFKKNHKSDFSSETSSFKIIDET